MTGAAPNGLRNPVNRVGVVPALFASAALAACTTLPEEVSQYEDPTRAIELADTPFFPQERYQCGPASLMTVLQSSGANTSMDSLVEQVYLPGRQGSLQIELMAATRAAGRTPYLIDGSMRAITAELEASRPVLVLQNLGVSWYPRWHYAVVVGVNPMTDQVMLRSGTDRRHVIASKTFLRTWRRSDYWAMVALRPGELPGNPDKGRYFTAIAGLEQTGHSHEARAGWQAALEQWPDEPIALFGLGNVEFALGNFPKAEGLYRQLLRLDPSLASARNNLAHCLARQGRKTEALEQIRLGLAAISGDEPMRLELEDSLREIQAGPDP
jgi:tetratricopeptide (TPR) repeat protein